MGYVNPKKNLIIKIPNFQGGLTNILAKLAALPVTLRCGDPFTSCCVILVRLGTLNAHFAGESNHYHIHRDTS